MQRTYDFRRSGSKVKFDTTSFLNWWFNSSGDDVQNVHQVSIDTVKEEPVGLPLESKSELDLLKASITHRRRPLPSVHRGADNPFVVTGYMDYDPKKAASRKHTTGRGSTSSPSSTWFNL
jgi:hypothetical protein